MLFFSYLFLKNLDWVSITVIWSSQFFNFGFEKIHFSIYFFLMIIKSSDLFSELIFLSHFFSHHSWILSVDFSSILFAFVYIPNYHSLLIEDCISFILENLSFSFEFLKALFMLVLVRLFNKFLWLFRSLSVNSHFIFVPVEFRPLLSWWSFLLWSLTLRFLFELLFFLLMLLLNFLFVLRLFFKRPLRVD